jgi:hypothetical protein
VIDSGGRIGLQGYLIGLTVVRSSLLGDRIR